MRQLKVEDTPCCQDFYNGDPDVIFLPDKDSRAQRHSRWHFSSLSPCAHCAVPTRFSRGLCREACRDPDNLNWLASPLVKAPYFWSGGQDLNPRRDRTWLAYWVEDPPWGQAFYNGDPDLIVWPDIEHCLSSCAIILVAWHAISRLTCPTQQQMTLL